MLKIKDIIEHLEAIAPPVYQESYDNAGLIIGDREQTAAGALLCLDATEEVVEEAIQLGCNLVVAHHPIVFRGLKRFTGSNYVERTIIKAIKNDISIYAIHTNLDNVYYKGVNGKIAERLGLQNTRVLSPKKELKKLTAVVSPEKIGALRAGLFEAGAGSVNGFEQQSFATLGVETAKGQTVASIKLEVVFASANQRAVVSAFQKIAQSVHYEIISLENHSLEIGAGLVGELPKPMKEIDFLKNLKKVMGAGCVKHTQLLGNLVTTVAVCGGAGGFLLPSAPMADGLI